MSDLQGRHQDVASIYSDDPIVIMAGLEDGARHSDCDSCKKVMMNARALIARLIRQAINRDA